MKTIMKTKRTAEVLTIENASKVATIQNIKNPRWGVWKFTKDGQPLNDGESCDIISNRRSSKVLSENNYHFWSVVSYK